MIDNVEWADLLDRFDELTPEEQKRLDEIMEEFQQTAQGQALQGVLSVLADLPPDALD